MLEESNCKGFWMDENDDIYIQYSGDKFAGSFNYLFAAENSKNDLLDLNKEIGDAVYWTFYESGLYCGTPIFIEN